MPLDLLAQAKQHVDSLFGLGDELAATAKAYGRTEDEIEASFGSAGPTAVSQLPTVFNQAAGLGASTAHPQRSIADILGGERR